MAVDTQNTPGGEDFDRSVRDLEGAWMPGLHPARVGGVVAGRSVPPGDRSRVVPDVDDVAVLAAARGPTGVRVQP